MGIYSAVSMLSINHALKYISYHWQVFGSNIRYLFVVMLGALQSRVKHSNLKLDKFKIFMATVITGSVLIFHFTDEVNLN